MVIIHRTVVDDCQSLRSNMYAGARCAAAWQPFNASSSNHSSGILPSFTRFGYKAAAAAAAGRAC
jgi:hypothetical protein